MSTRHPVHVVIIHTHTDTRKSPFENLSSTVKTTATHIDRPLTLLKGITLVVESLIVTKHKHSQ